MSERVIVIGASGHGKVAADIVRCSGDTLLGFLDDNALLPPMVAGIPVLGRVADYVNYPDTSFVIGIGSSAVREKIARQLDGVRWYTAIHPSAVISALDTEIGAGSVVTKDIPANSIAVGNPCRVLRTLGEADSMKHRLERFGDEEFVFE